MKRISAFFMIVVILLSAPGSFAADEYANRGEVAAMLLEAADFYNPGVVKSDIIKGYEDGLLHEERNVTRAEALVMLSRAFGQLPKPKGHNKRVALTAEDFTDIPVWAQEELVPVFDSGIVAGTSKGIFSPDNYVTKKQMQLFIERVYALYGTNLKDDFYAAINKEELESLSILPGNVTAGTLENIQIEASTQVDGIINEIISQNNRTGTPKQKMADLYKCVADTNARNREGIKPIKPYLDMIDKVNNISELTELEYIISEEICVNSFMGFSLAVDFSDSSKYVLCFGGMTPIMNKELYFENDEKQEAYITYLKTMLEIGGEDSETAEKNAKDYFELEKSLAASMLSSEEQNDVNKFYTVSSYGKLSVMFPDFDLDKVAGICGFSKADKVVVLDMGLTEKFARIYNQSNIDELKTTMKLSVLISCGYMLGNNFEKAEYALDKVILGISGRHTIHQQAVSVIEDVMPEYLSQIYVEKYFDEESKKDVEKMTYDIIGIFKKRIDDLTWMSAETKEKAKLKLSTLNVKIGYPESTETYLDDVSIISPDKGGTYFNNILAIAKAAREQYKYIQFSKVDRDMWLIEPYTVNAMYNPSLNEIVLPAAILQAPFYDKDASYEKNLGGIGYVIAHEITHAFDSNGAQFDEFGNVNNWWTEQDYKAFELLCEDVVKFYDGKESVPSVQTNGRLTLNENIADIGAIACITQLAKEKGNTDFKLLYESVANAWVNTSSREYAEYLSKIDVHSNGKLRVNRVLVNFGEFYEAFDIKETDGMYVPPEDRIMVW